MPAPYRLTACKRNRSRPGWMAWGCSGSAVREVRAEAVFRAPRTTGGDCSSARVGDRRLVRWDAKIGQGDLLCLNQSASHRRCGPIASSSGVLLDKVRAKLGYRDSCTYTSCAENQASSFATSGSRRQSRRGTRVLSTLRAWFAPEPDTVPKEVWRKSVTDCRQPDDHRQVCVSHGYSVLRIDDVEALTEQVRLIASRPMLEDSDIHAMLQRRVLDTVVEITRLGEQDVYDGTVSWHNNFVAQGISSITASNKMPIWSFC